MDKELGGYLGILKWVLQTQKESDGTVASQYESMTDEDRTFLENALKSITVDEVKRLEQLSKTLEDGDESPEALDRKEEALDGILDSVDSIDNARDLHIIGGLRPVIGFLSHARPGLRSRAAEVIATVAANNPKCQQWVLEGNALPALVAAVTTDVDLGVRAKALMAIGALVRGYEPAEAAFLEMKGLDVLRESLASDEKRVRTKAVFLLRHLVATSTWDWKDAVVDSGYLPLLAACIESDDFTTRENALMTLRHVVEGAGAAKRVSAIRENSSVKQAVDGVLSRHADAANDLTLDAEELAAALAVQSALA